MNDDNTPWYATPVRHAMSTTLVTVNVDTALTAVLRTLETRDVSSVPVVDAGGAAIGIVSLTDLLRAAKLHMERPGAALSIALPSARAQDVMVTDLVQVNDDAPLHDVAERMIERRVHRVLVTHAGKLAGICSTRDLMQAVRASHLVTPLKEVMSSPAQTIDIGESADQAIDALARAEVRGLVVTDGSWPVGVFTQLEALKARALPDAFRARTPVEALMSYETICLDVSTPVYRVAAQAMALRVRRILAVEHRMLRGVVTGWDLARVLRDAARG